MSTLPNPDFWRGRRVFLTGHTGFKGAWLALWLGRLGARVCGYALPPAGAPTLYGLGAVAEGLASTFADIRDAAALRAAMAEAAPEVVLHLAAQPLVRESYRTPAETFATNVMGTVNLLEAARATPGVRVVQVITTDKCYDNREHLWPYREIDPLGGQDPYSASKAATELAVASWRASFLAAAGISLASARAGNVIGGGDWAADRLVPDCVRALQAGEPVRLRYPGAIRPWQHVLEPLAGYLVLAERQWAEPDRHAEAWNFGPDTADAIPVQAVAERFLAAWGSGRLVVDSGERPHEAGVLKLDITKARTLLGWAPRWDVRRAVDETAGWYRRVLVDGEPARRCCLEQIEAYTA